MKKRLSFLMAMFIFLFAFSSNIFAMDIRDDINNHNSLFISSNEITNGALEYANNEKYNVFLSLKDVLGEKFYKLNSYDKILYGNGFKLNEIEYIPIITEEYVISLLAITETDGEYSWTLSEDFSDGLNEIASLTSIENPALLYTQNGNVYAMISENSYQLTFNPKIYDYGEYQLYNLNSIEQEEVIDVFNVNNQSNIKTDYPIYESRAVSSKYLSLDLAETQNDQSWCSAFAGAQILRYRGKGNIYAKDIMKYFYPKVGNSKLKEKSISNKQLMEYANKKKSYPSRKNGTIRFSSVKKQINSDKPIYLGCEGKKTYKKARHALVLRGYNTNSNSYSVWNPWNAKYVSMSASSKSIAVSGGKFVWDTTIYDW